MWGRNGSLKPTVLSRGGTAKTEEEEAAVQGVPQDGGAAGSVYAGTTCMPICAL